MYISLKEEDEFNRYVYICLSVGWPGIRTTHGLDQLVKRMAYKNVCWNWLKPRRKKKSRIIDAAFMNTEELMCIIHCQVLV